MENRFQPKCDFLMSMLLAQKTPALATCEFVEQWKFIAE